FGTGTRGGDATSRTCLLSEALFCPCPPPPLANPSRRVSLRDRTECGRRGGRPTARAVRGGAVRVSGRGGRVRFGVGPGFRLARQHEVFVTPHHQEHA